MKSGNVSQETIKVSDQMVHKQRGFMAKQRYTKNMQLSDRFFRYLLASDSLIRFLAPLFQKLPGSNIETRTLDARKALELMFLEDNMQMAPFDVKSL